jgi:hypothetical protein
VSSAKKARKTSVVRGITFIYKLYRVGVRTEPCGTPACISQHVDISPSAVTLNGLLEGNELMNLIMLSEKCNFESL